MMREVPSALGRLARAAVVAVGSRLAVMIVWMGLLGRVPEDHLHCHGWYL